MSEQFIVDGLLSIAAVTQVAAAGVALLLLFRGSRHRAWLLVAIALIIQGWRRLHTVLTGSSSPMFEASTALLVSVLLLFGIVLIRSLITSLNRRSEELTTARTQAELFLDVTGAIVVVMDAEGRFLQINEKGRALLGLEDERIDIQEWFSTLPPVGMREKLEEGFRAFMSGEYGDDDYLEYPLTNTRGQELHIVWHRHIVRDENGGVGGIISAGIDVTTRRRAESESAFRSMLLDRTSDAVLVTELGGVIVYANDAGCALARREREALLGTSITEFMTPEWLEVLEERQRQLRHMGSVITEFEATIEGETLPIEVHSHLIDADGRNLVVSVLRDITERKRAEATIRHLAYHDALTGLPNRSLFEDRAEMAIARARRHDEQLALLFLDVDSLKLVNDSFGHAVADRVLCRLSERLLGVFRDEDTIARIGGDEFAILLPATDAETAHVAAEKAIGELQRPFKIFGKDIRASVSIGAAVFPHDGETLDELLASSDAAMYRSKERGGNSLSFYTAEMKVEMLETLTLRHDLGIALERGELVIHYQPQVHMGTGAIVGVEALLRWAHPERGLLPPMSFIRLAEESGAIEPIGGWVLEEACINAQRWSDLGHGPLRIAVNVSARQFRGPEFVSALRETLSRTGLEPSRLQIEITETVAMEDPESAISVLEMIRDTGVTVAIDDFGTGHSSMAYLKRFPVSVTKIDRTFVQDVDVDENSQFLVSTIVGLADSLGLEVIAEGVERSEQVAFLRALGCEQAQGFLYHPAMPAEDLLTVLAANRLRNIVPQ